jgi:hypothetical protein
VHGCGEGQASDRALLDLLLVLSERVELGDHDAYSQVRKQ